MVPSLSNLLQASAEPDDYLGKTEKTPKASEWRASIESYSPDPIIVEAVSKIKEKATLVCFSAYWCKDCLKHVPILVKTLQKAGNKNLRLAMLDYDQNKETVGEAGVKATTTFIIFGARRTEIGRIIENPSPPFKSIVEKLINKFAPKK
jgi:thiol-disulfide isomerase/thioredoxin